ncbi:MAG TPA: alpha/beta hydrolase [Pseudonocardiaceae bacterium]|nr:alpha/beta hydrolase [Pseudonocardiaceae bacterium]
MTDATLHDGSRIDLVIRGSGPTVLLTVNPVPSVGDKADELRRWGVDPELGAKLVDALAGTFRVVAFDYEGHVLAEPKSDTLTPDTIAADILAVADAAGADTFAYYGYSWLALNGLQLAIRTDRLTALAMGGFPPIGGPYAEMLAVTLATHDMSARSVPDVGLSEPVTRQFVTLYQALTGFDDRSVRPAITCPRLCFVGSADRIAYDERWGGVTVDIAGATVANRAELTAAGWDVRVLDGLDHTQAMQPDNVLPVLRPWLVEHVGT